jgi:hypothetical protein
MRFRAQPIVPRYEVRIQVGDGVDVFTVCADSPDLAAQTATHWLEYTHRTGRPGDAELIDGECLPGDLGVPGPGLEGIRGQQGVNHRRFAADGSGLATLYRDSQGRPVPDMYLRAAQLGWIHPIAGYFLGQIPIFRSNPYWHLQLLPSLPGSCLGQTETLDELVVRAPDLKDSLQHVWRGPTPVDLYVIRDLAAVKKAAWPTASMPRGAVELVGRGEAAANPEFRPEQR